MKKIGGKNKDVGRMLAEQEQESSAIGEPSKDKSPGKGQKGSHLLGRGKELKGPSPLKII